MGNLCGKQSDDNFAQPGRTVGSAPSTQVPNPRAPIPKAAPKVSGPGRTVGGGVDGGVGGDPRAAAARAAEVSEMLEICVTGGVVKVDGVELMADLMTMQERAKKTQTQGRGKLGEQLAAQKKQTRGDTLEQASRETRGQRDADENTAVRNWN